MKRIVSLLAVLAVAVAGCGPNDPGAPAVTLLSPEGANHRAAVFSPDGGQVAYWTPNAAGWELVVAKADLSEPRTMASSSSPAPIVWSPDGSLVAFSTDAWGGPDVAMVPAGGGEVRRLTASPAFEVPIAWHRDGDRLVYLQTAEGGGVRASVVSLATGDGAPLLTDDRPHIAIWSPDGSRLAVDFFAGGKGTIWVADSAGGNLRQLTTDGFEETNFPSVWSPDGSEVLYVSRRTGTADIWAVPADGGAPRQLTRDLRDDTQPVLSSDGRWVAFLSTRGQQTDVWVVPWTGGEAIRVTDDATEEADLQWIGPGTRLAFQKVSVTSTLWAVDAMTGTERQLTPDSIQVGGFRVSRDGSELVYEVVRGGGVIDLHVTPLAGGPPRVLVAGTHENRLGAWSPDGQTIVFTSTRAGSTDIWTVPAAGGEPRQLVNWPTFEADPQWTPDGSGVYFRSERDAAKLGDVWLVPAAGGEPRRITTVGRVTDYTQSSTSPDLFVNLIGGRAGQFVLTRLRPDGSLQTLWDRSNVFGVSPDGVMPGGDSVVFNTQLPEGGEGSFLISTRTGQGRQLLGKGELAADFSRDGTLLAYTFGGATQDLGILDMKDGTTRRLTNTPERESGYWWAGDTKTIVVARRAPVSRIATVDVGPLLQGGR
jgi:Tol biopolymer transport system component